jgi:K+-sensing histidine kinase KdpD
MNEHPAQRQSRANLPNSDEGVGGRHFPLKPWQAYGLAVAATAATLGVRLALDRALGGRPTLVMFILSIVVSAYAGGVAWRLLATALSYLVPATICLPPIHSFRIASAVQQFQQVLLVVSG